MHIPPHLILPQDLVDILDKEDGAVRRMHVTDAKHAMDVEPKRYQLAGAEPEPEDKAEIEHDEEEDEADDV